MSTDHFSTIAIIGLGLIGGSFARLIRHQQPQAQILGLDKPEVLDAALAENVLSNSLQSLEDERLYSADLIVLATHPYESYELLQTLVENAAQPIALMDLGSTKTRICDLADQLAKPFCFVGGHPLAGREVSGFANSRWDLFLNKRFLLTPSLKTEEAFLNRLTQWLSQVGVIPVVVDRQQHDRLMSLVSHFPQFYAVALANLLNRHNPEEALHFLGGGIDDQMRLMASPYTMWREVFQDNKENLNQILGDFITILQGMQQALESDDMTDFFKTSASIHQMYKAFRQA